MNVTVLADALAPVLRELVDATMAPALERMAAADRRVAELEAALKEAGIVIDAIGAKILEMPKVPTGEEVALLVPPAAAGKDADPEVIAGMVKEAVGALMTPLQREVDAALTNVRSVNEAAAVEMKAACERSIADLPKVPTAAEVAAFVPAPKDGKDVEPEVVRAMVAEAVDALPKPIDGKSVTLEEVRPLVDEVVAAKVAELPPAKDGKDADPAEIAAEVERQLAARPAPQDGKDLDPEVIRGMVAEEVAAQPKPKDGESVTVEQLQPIVDKLVTDGIDCIRLTLVDEFQKSFAALPAIPTAEEVAALMPKAVNGKDASPEAIAAEVEKVLATWERPKDGNSVTVEDVLPVLQERLDKLVAALPVAKDGVGLAGFLIDSDGVLFGTLTDGSLHKLGLVRGKDGLDGLSDGDFELVDGATEFTLRLVRGEQVKEWKIAKPTMADMHRGIWHEGSYKRGSVVTWGGSQWLALADTDAKPETTKDWTLVVKRGRDGKDGVVVEPKDPTKVKLR